MKKDFLIVGQGLAGSHLAWELFRKGYSVVIWDSDTPDTSSKKAAGIYNPITGREMKKTWLADELFSKIESHYQKLETELGGSFLCSLPIYRPFHSAGEQNDWVAKYQDEAFRDFIEKITPSLGIENLNDPYGGLHLKKSGFVDLPEMLEVFKGFFRNKGILIQEEFKIQESQDVADKVIFCEGYYFHQNPFWRELPFKPVRGEIIDIHCDLPPERIYNRGVFMVPKEGYFRVGSTYHHDNLSFTAQKKGIDELKRRLEKLYSGEFEITGTSAGVRPATHDRRPYIGWHPENKTVGIFNGFGAKGVSLVPYFSKLFVDSIIRKAVIPSEANVSRVL